MTRDDASKSRQPPTAAQAELSETLRRRISALAEPGGAPLDAEAQRRVLAEVSAHAQRLERARVRQKLVVISGASLLSAAAALWLFVRPSPQTGSQPSAAVPACALPVLRDGASFESLDGGRGHLSLGRFGDLVALESSQVAIEHSQPCELALRLEHGVLAGDLTKLRPARLLIRTPQGDVIVTGTRFSVDADAGLDIVLASGVVDVVFRDQDTVRIAAGTRLRRASAARRPESRPLTASDEQELTRRLDLRARNPAAGELERRTREPATSDALQPPEPLHGDEPAALPKDAAKTNPRHAKDEDPALQLTAAEAARRSGRIEDARAAYRLASQGQSDAAEVALLRWVRLELEVAQPKAALHWLDAHDRRFARARLGAEAGWLRVQIWQALDEPDRARSAARVLIERHRDSPQAAAARSMLHEP